MLSLRLGAVDDFPFIDPPEPKAVREGYRLLQELGAVEASGRLTPLGRQLARLPVDPALGRMILAAAESGHLAPVLVIASALAVQDPRERPAEQKQQSDQAHARFRHPKSDFMAWLALWRYYEVQRQSLSQNQLRKLCQREFLSFLRMREWRDVHRQLLIACRQLGFRVQAEALGSGEAVLPGEEGDGHAQEADYEGIHRALLCGLLGNIGQRDQGREYLGARNRRLVLFPGSSVQRKPPPWLVAADIVETSRVFARTVAAIEPEWLLDCNPSLLRRQYYEPRWQRSSGRVIATERVTLFGLTISDRNTVHYGPIDRETARTLLIREGLVAGRWRSRPSFLRHNLALYQELVALEEKLRRRDLLADEEQMFAFYDQRLPADITTAARLQRWLKRDTGAERRLHMARGDLLLRAPGSAEEAQFPDHLHWGGVDYPLSYTFDPGGEQDGVTVTVPVALLNRVPRYRFEWLVPGLLREKCIALLKTLPKSQRKQLVPAPDRVDAVLPRLQADDVPLAQALARALSEAHALRLAEADFSTETLDAFYRMHVQVVDENGAVLARSRDLAALLERFRNEEAAGQSAAPQHSPRRQGVLRWDFGELPKRWCFTQAGMEIESWPALADTQDAVAIELFDYAEDAALSHRRGLARLAQLQLGKPLRALRKQLLQSNEAQLMLAAAGLVREALLDDLLRAVTLEACGLFDGDCRDDVAFDRAVAKGNRQLVAVANEYENLLLNALRPLPAMRRALERLSEGMAWAREDIPAQLGRLLCEGFLAETPLERLRHFPRYTKALAYRAERVPAQPAKDERATVQVQSAEAPMQSALAERPGLLLLCAPAATYRQMLEEFRVSLFAQQLGTAMPVSGKRLQQQWQQVADWLRAHPR
jgi:ATP-dependent helicase HrpA